MRQRVAAPHAASAGDVLVWLGSGDRGLSGAEPRRRLAHCGPNALPEPAGPGAPALLLRQARNPLIVTLLISAAVAITLGRTTDGLVVLAVVVLNALIGFAHESRAARAIGALAQLVVEPVTVVREGTLRTLPATELVPGDVVRLEPGDKVDADIRILTARGLRIDESALTGESVPVDKGEEAVPAGTAVADRSSMAHAGTIVRAGTGTGVVTATGARTQLGQIAALLERAEEPRTPLTVALAGIAHVITRAVAVVAVLVLLVGLLRGWPAADATLAAVTLAVAAIPEGLPAVVTIALAVGVQRMARRKALVRQLPAVETLGSTTVVATDKTGTLTRNAMVVQEVWTPAGTSAPSGGAGADGIRAVLEAGALCNDAELPAHGRPPEGDPTEVALLQAARATGLDHGVLRREHPRLDVVPFSSEAKAMTTLHAAPGGARFAVTKGAPEVVLRDLPAADRLVAEREAGRMAAEGQRVLALVRREVGDGTASLAGRRGGRVRLLGLVGLVDPPRSGVADAVAAVRGAGIRVMMVTGDHPETARAIARRVGMRHQRAITGREVERADDATLRRLVRDVDVVARVTPEHKLRLVRALQREGHVVAMTGDGVNDAPALEQADLGVAMGLRSTSAAREAADVVLADDDFATIEAAVHEGRRVYDNVVKALTFVLPTNLGEALVVLVAVCAFPLRDGVPVLPIEPVQILWVNLVATVALALPLAFEAPGPGLMRRPPRRPGTPLLERAVVLRTLLVATVMAAGAIALFLVEQHASGAGEAASPRAQTLAVTSIALFQCLYLLGCRNPGGRVRDVGWATNPAVYGGIALLLVLQAAFVYLPPLQEAFGTAALEPRQWLMAAGVALLGPVVARVPIRGRP